MKNTILGIALVSMLLTLMALISVVSREPRQAQGSTFVGSEYYATTTSSSLTSSACMPVMTSYKTLGSVVVTLTSNAGLAIYDATTTSSHADHATTTIAYFPSTAAGTYTFDVRAKRGLCITSVGAVGVASTTVTWRY